MAFVNLFANPSGRRTTTGYVVFGGTIGQDANADTYVRASGSVAPSNLGLTLETMTIGGGKLLPSSTYTYSASIYGSATTVRLRVAGTGVTTTDSADVQPATGFNRVSLTFTTNPSGSVSFYVVNSAAAVALNVVAFANSQLEPGAVANPYLDGTASNYTWAGVADASATWGPVVTVVSKPAFTPPRNEITLSIPAGYVMKNPDLSRIANGVGTEVRTQPIAGLDTRVIYDYEMPYDLPVSYEFATDFLNPTGSTIWDEVWTNLTAWSHTDSTWSVSGGKVTFNPGADSSNHWIYRAVPLGSYRIVVSSLAATSTSGVWSSRLDIGGLLSLYVVAGGYIQVYDPVSGAATTTSIVGSSPVTIDLLGSSIIVSGLGGSWASGARASTDISQVQIIGSVPSGSGTFTVGEVKLATYPVPTHLDELSTPTALSPAAAWLIHPSNPSLSMPVSSHDRSTVSIRSLGEAVDASQATEHRILGQDTPIFTSSGPRMASKVQMVIGVRTAAQEQALKALLKDGRPLLFRAPASYPIGLEEGFYSVGDVTRTRLSQRLGDPMRDFTLPLTQVQPPVANVENVGWSWAALAAEFKTWRDVAAAFNTWADVLTNNRKPGY